ncbi:MAG: hypothetical protein JO181_17000, partial [Solirubrobacterales bacterium]|nr:hypothetical protein [Solirubrobacterales bacterium]
VLEPAVDPELLSVDVSIEVADVDAAYAIAQAQGLDVVRELADGPWRIRRFFIRGRANEQPRLRGSESPLYEQIIPQVPAAPPVTLDERLGPGARRGLGHPRICSSLRQATLTANSRFWFPMQRALIAGDAMASRDGQPIPGVFNVDPAEAAATYATLGGRERSRCVGCPGDPEGTGPGPTRTTFSISLPKRHKPSPGRACTWRSHRSACTGS